MGKNVDYSENIVSNKEMESYLSHLWHDWEISRVIDPNQIQSEKQMHQTISNMLRTLIHGQKIVDTRTEKHLKREILQV